MIVELVSYHDDQAEAEVLSMLDVGDDPPEWFAEGPAENLKPPRGDEVGVRLRTLLRQLERRRRPGDPAIWARRG